MPRPWEVAGTGPTDLLPDEALLNLLQSRHRSGDLAGYTSMLCRAGIGVCDDKACICLCHEEIRFPSWEAG